MSFGFGVVKWLWRRRGMVVLVVMLGLWGWLVFVDGTSYAAASNHNWGSGTPFRECTNRGLTNYGPKTGQKWISGSYKNLYRCTAPTTTTTTTTPITTTTRTPDWGSGTPFRECTNRGLTNYGPKTGQKWISGSYKNLYRCTAPTTTTSTTTTTTTIRAADWGSGLTFRECTSRGLTNYGPKAGQKWISGSYKDLYRCIAADAVRVADWGSGTTYRECRDGGLTNYGSRTGQKWIGGVIKDLYRCAAPTTTTSTTTTTTITTTTTTTAPVTTTLSKHAKASVAYTSSFPRSRVLPFRDVTDVSLIVRSSSPFTHVKYYYQCYNINDRNGQVIRSAPKVVKVSSSTISSVSIATVTWTVGTGPGDGECHGGSGSVLFFAHVRHNDPAQPNSETDWSPMSSFSVYLRIAKTPPPAECSPITLASIDDNTQLGSLGTTLTDQSRHADCSSKQYEILLSGSSSPRVVIRLTSTAGFTVKIGGTPTNGRSAICSQARTPACTLRMERVLSLAGTHIIEVSGLTEAQTFTITAELLEPLACLPVGIATLGSDSSPGILADKENETKATVCNSKRYSVTVVGSFSHLVRVQITSVSSFSLKVTGNPSGGQRPTCTTLFCTARLSRVLNTPGVHVVEISGLTDTQTFDVEVVLLVLPVCQPVASENFAIGTGTSTGVVETKYNQARHAMCNSKRYSLVVRGSTQHPVAVEVESATSFSLMIGDMPAGGERATCVANTVQVCTARVARAVNSSDIHTIEIRKLASAQTFTIKLELLEQLSPPTGIKANGDSPSETDGRAIVEWTAVPRASAYMLRYRPYCASSPCSAWTNRTITKTDTSYTITSLTTGQLYTIQLKSIVEVTNLDNWSDPIYAYPTPPIPARPDSVGPVPLWVNPSYTDYNYIMCLDTISLIQDDDPNTPFVNERQQVIDAIVNGIEIWETVTHGIVTATRNTRDSTPCNKGYNNRHANTIDIVDRTVMLMRCEPKAKPTLNSKPKPSTGCAGSRIVAGSLSYVRISILNTRSLAGSCSEFSGTVTHEGGHAFGLADFPPDAYTDSHVEMTVMDYQFSPDCTPTPFDVVAIKAIHQSQPQPEQGS